MDRRLDRTFGLLTGTVLAEVKSEATPIMQNIFLLRVLTARSIFSADSRCAGEPPGLGVAHDTIGGEDRQRRPDETESRRMGPAERFAEHENRDQELQGRPDILHHADGRELQTTC